ncbi:MAG: outer membrane protein assembly factor BamA [Verrucomicrobiales bacterium]|jgi:outer membrane protein insertion porin family|nr:outer membrane protein assembly factor BamA [Verrucomicrobiales bacterium]
MNDWKKLNWGAPLTLAFGCMVLAWFCAADVRAENELPVKTDSVGVGSSPSDGAVSAARPTPPREVSADSEGKVLVSAPTATDATAARGPIVKDIEIEYEGPHSVDRSVIISNMRTTIGQPYSLSAVEEDVRNLYATGLFVNLRIYDEPLGDGLKIMVLVQPKPIIRELAVAGCKVITEARVRKEIKSKEGDPLSEQKVADDMRKVLEYYRSKGFFEAKVEYKIDVNEQAGRATIKFTVKEGERAWVDKISFAGNKAFTEDELRKNFKTKKKNWLSWINKSGLLNEEQWTADLKTLKEFYQNHGYIDIDIKDIKKTYPEPEKIEVKITVFEGIQYHVGAITFEGNQLYTREQIMSRFKTVQDGMLEGGVFSPTGLDADITAIHDLYGQRGYIDIKIEPVRQPNIESGRMDILFRVTENSQSYVEKIVIQGNNTTKDKVIRRELTLVPGEVYDMVNADAAKKRLHNLGYFSKVDVTAEDTSVPGRKDMLVTVEEQRTGNVTFGIGFSTVDSLLGFVELSQGNFDIANPPRFTGAGQKFRTRLQYGIERRDFLLSWTEPWFLDRQLSFGFDLFYNDAQYYDSDYKTQRYGGSVRVDKALNQFWRVGLRYQLTENDIYDVNADANSQLHREVGWRSESAVTASITYDSRDDLFLTRHGEKFEFAATGAGGPLWGQTNIWKLQMSGEKYFTFPYDIILGLRGTTGVADKFDNSEFVPLFERFFVGGARSVRGFSYQSIGPRDRQGHSLGGNTMGYATAEVTWPIIDRVRGAFFVDGGFDNAGTFEYTDAINIGAGLGLRLNLPIGPLRLDFGCPIVTDGTSGKFGHFQFNFDVGYQF